VCAADGAPQGVPFLSGKPSREPYPKKVPLTKAERRALQEKQRAAKAAEKGEGDQKGGQKPGAKAAPKAAAKPAGKGSATGKGDQQHDDSKSAAKKSKSSVIHRTKTQKKVALFSHLPQYESESSLSLNIGFSKVQWLADRSGLLQCVMRVFSERDSSCHSLFGSQIRERDHCRRKCTMCGNVDGI
jgi:hypothetical protein